MNEIMTTTGGELSVEQVENQVQKIQQLMKSVMKEGEHYGKIPGTEKNCLHKSGAEKLGLIFRLVPKFEVTKTELPNLHREYEVTCSLYTLSGVFVGQGVGSCSTMESKYRYRRAKNFEILDEPIPDDYREQKEKYRKEGFGCKQIDGEWHWVQYDSGEKQENPDIADVYNTVLKIAKKRSHVDATLSTTAASDIFTQDLDEDPENELDPSGDKPPKKTSSKENKGNNPKGSKTGNKTETNDDAILNELYQSNLSKEDKEKFKNGYLGTPSEHKATYYNDVIKKQIAIAGKKPPVRGKTEEKPYTEVEPEDTDFTFTDDTIPFETETENNNDKQEISHDNQNTGNGKKTKIGQEVPAGLFGGQS